MTATLWLDTEKERTVELGPTLDFYAALSEMGKLAGPDWLKDWPALFGVAAQVESQGDADPSWLREVKNEARRFLHRYRESLSPLSKDILELLKNA